MKLPNTKKEELIELFVRCQNEDGGFGGNVGHDSHITATHYVILILFQYGVIDRIDVNKASSYIASLQNDDVENHLT